MCCWKLPVKERESEMWQCHRACWNLKENKRIQEGEMWAELSINTSPSSLPMLPSPPSPSSLTALGFCFLHLWLSVSSHHQVSHWDDCKSARILWREWRWDNGNDGLCTVWRHGMIDTEHSFAGFPICPFTSSSSSDQTSLWCSKAI